MGCRGIRGLGLRRAGRVSACGSRGNGSRRELRRDCGDAGAAWRGRGGATELTGGPSLSAKARALAGGPGCGSGAPCASSWAERATLAGGTGRSGRKTRGWAGLSDALVGRVCAGGKSGPKRDWGKGEGEGWADRGAGREGAGPSAGRDWADGFGLLLG